MENQRLKPVFIINQVIKSLFLEVSILIRCVPTFFFYIILNFFIILQNYWDRAYISNKNHTLFIFHHFYLAVTSITCRISSYPILANFDKFEKETHAKKKEHSEYPFEHSPLLHQHFHLFPTMSIPIAA